VNLPAAGNAGFRWESSEPPFHGGCRAAGNLNGNTAGATLMLEINKVRYQHGGRMAICLPKPADVGWHMCAGSCGRGPGGEPAFDFQRAMQRHTWEPEHRLQTL